MLYELKGLLRRRQDSEAFHPTGRHEVLPSDPRVLALRRTSPDGMETMLCLHNVSDRPAEAAGELLGPYEARWLPGR